MADTLRIEIRTVDSVTGAPTATVVGTSDAIDSATVTHDAFYSFTFPSTVVLPDTSVRYALVLVESGGTETPVGWVAATTGEYEDGTRWTGTPWAAVSGEDQYFRVYYEAPQEATVVEHAVTFDPEDGDRVFVDVDNAMELDMRFSISFAIDGTGTMLRADPTGLRKSDPVPFFHEVLMRAPLSYVDVWTFDDLVTEMTAEGPSRVTADWHAAFGSILSSGVDSRLWTTAERAVGNLEAATVVECIVRDDEVSAVLDQMRLMNRIDYDLLATIEPDYDPATGFAGIAGFGKLVDYIVQEFADSQSGIGMVISDGYDDGQDDITPDDVVIAADAVRGTARTPVHGFVIGGDHDAAGLRAISEGTGGLLFELGSNVSRLDDDLDRLLNDPDLTIFQGSHEGTVEFDERTYLDGIMLDVEVPATAATTFEIALTFDGSTWGDWVTVTPNSRRDIRAFVMAFRYRIRMWLGNEYGDNYHDIFGEYGTYEYTYRRDAYPSPRVTGLTYWTVTPAIRYGFTEATAVASEPSEYVLAPLLDLPDGMTMSWGVVRGDSTDWADAESVITNRKGILPNRKQTIYFTPDLSLTGLSTTRADQNGYIYRVLYEDGTNATWETTDEITVYVGSEQINSETTPYQLNGMNGTIWFAQPRAAGDVITVDIFRPGEAASRSGEIATSGDGRLYFSKNGSWPWDATVTVRVNGVIRQDGFTLTPADGTVFFFRELSDTDVVTLEIQHSLSVRVAYELKNYTTEDAAEPDFAIVFATEPQTDTALIASLTDPPVASAVTLLPSNRSIDAENPDAVIQVSLTDRLVVSYDFYQAQNNADAGSTIEWFVRRYGDATYESYAAYHDRNVMRSSDVPDDNPSGPFQPGDNWYVVVTPVDVNGVGTPVRSNIVLIGDLVPPYIVQNTETETNVTMTGIPSLRTDETTGDLIATKQDLTASFTYVDPNPGGDSDDTSSCIVRWYKNGVATVQYTGLTLDGDRLTTGDVWYYVVTPYDGVNYGVAVQSVDVGIRGDEGTTE